MTSTAIEVLTAAPTKPADIVGAIGDLRALTDVIDDHERSLRGRLEEQVQALSEASGGQFTVRADTGTAYIAGGNPKPRVSNPDAFGRWCLDRHPDLGLAVCTDAVEIVDQDAAVALYRACVDQSGNRKQLHETAEAAMKQVQVWRIVDDAVKALQDDGLIAIPDGADFAVDTETGEPVPGVTVGYSRVQLTVKPDPARRELMAGRLRDALGLAPEVEA